MGATCTRECSESFNLFASRLHVENGNATAEEISGSEQFNGNTDPALFEKIKTTAKDEVELYAKLLDYIGKNRDNGLNRRDMLKLTMSSPMVKNPDNLDPDTAELSPEISTHITNVIEIDSMGLEFAWALSLSKVVAECCENASALKDAFAIYTEHKDDKYNRPIMRGQALESLTWQPDQGALFLWLRDAM